MSLVTTLAIVAGSFIGFIILVAVCILGCHYLYWKGGVNKHNPDMRGKTVVITGGTDGIGKETVIRLAKLGAKVIFTGRSESKARDVLKSVPQESDVEFKRVDQSNLIEIKEFADYLFSKIDKIDVLMNNAGLMSSKFKRSQQNIEFTMAVNHFAHFYLTDLLLPLLKKPEQSRIVNTASLAHTMA